MSWQKFAVNSLNVVFQTSNHYKRFSSSLKTLKIIFINFERQYPSCHMQTIVKICLYVKIFHYMLLSSEKNATRKSFSWEKATSLTKIRSTSKLDNQNSFSAFKQNSHLILSLCKSSLSKKWKTAWDKYLIIKWNFVL